MKNTVKKPDCNGNALPIEIGKGLNEIHANKVSSVRTKLVGVQVSESKKKAFIVACELLKLKQTDVLNLAIDNVISQAINS